METVLLDATLPIKFSLSAGPDHEGIYAEPDEVVIQVKISGQTVQEFKLTEATVFLDDEAAGVYRASVFADALGTATIIGKATWTDDDYTFIAEYRVEVIDPFRVDI